MKKLVYSLAITLLIAVSIPSIGWSRQTSHHSSRSESSTSSWSDQGTEYYHSRDGSQVHRPTKDHTPDSSERVTAECRDGTHSYSHSHRGTCSHHGGVAEWK